MDTAKLMSSDVLIVSRDGDYGLLRDSTYYLNDWLLQEFRSRVSRKRKAELSRSLSTALRRLNIKVTPAEEKEERNIIAQNLGRGIRLFPPFWPAILENLAKKAPTFCSRLKKACEVSYANDRLRILFPKYDGEFSETLDGTALCVFLDEIFKEMDFAPLKEISFAEKPVQPVVLDDFAELFT